MNIYILWFIIANISNESKIMLIEKYNNEENIYNNIDNIIKIRLLKGNEGKRLKETTLESGEKLEAYLEKENISFVIYNSSNYPNKLKNITEPPYVLFYKGDISLLYSDMVAIVGARRNTIYGEQVTKIIVNELSAVPYGVISGVAYGIDSIAHREVLVNEGKTIGVLGCGIDIIYPKTNRKLYNQISQKGLLISEFLPGTKPFAHNFPRRNRIISGLSNGVIVVEATIKSGSLITANFALDQGKRVMAVPGSVMNEMSRGCHKLLSDGAEWFFGIDDLYYFLNLTKNKEINKVKNVLNECLLKIIGEQPIHIDEIIESVNIDRIALFELLFEMQNRNEIICLPGNYYAKIS